MFTIFAKSGDHLRIGIAFVLASGFAVSAFLLNWLTLSGAQSASVLGTIAYGLGNWQMALLVLTFIISASLLSKDIDANDESLTIKFRRTSGQVWANGFWFAFWLIIWFITQQIMFIAAAVASIATANADTWATEIGTKTKGSTYLITTLKKVKTGTSGGISVQGSLAAIMGALLIAFIFWITAENATISWFLIIALAGVAGCFFDSYLGARFEGRKFTVKYFSKRSPLTIQINNNNNVNWIAVGSSSIIVLLITLILKI